MHCLYEPAYDSLILRALDLLYRMDYSAADSAFNTLPDIPARSYFRGLVLVNRFNDLGDTAALFRAKALWEKFDQSTSATANNNQALYRGLTELQLSYVAGVTGRQIRAARLGRQAIGKVRPFAGKAEADAAMALYDYYKASLLKGVDWVPFVTADEEAPLAKLEKAIPESRYLREILQTTLLWLYYDREKFATGLGLIEAFLKRYPENRLYRQIQADFYFRKGDVALARSLHEELRREYTELGKAYPSPPYLPIGYLSSVGNLAKIYASQKQPELMEGQLKVWQAPEFRSLMDWLPSSLKREVKSLHK